MLPPAGQGRLCPDTHPLQPGVPQPKLRPAGLTLPRFSCNSVKPGAASAPTSSWAGSLSAEDCGLSTWDGAAGYARPGAQYKQVWGERSLCQGPRSILAGLSRQEGARPGRQEAGQPFPGFSPPGSAEPRKCSRGKGLALQREVEGSHAGAAMQQQQDALPGQAPCSTAIEAQWRVGRGAPGQVWLCPSVG